MVLILRDDYIKLVQELIEFETNMGFVIVISLPFILLGLIIALAAYLLGRARAQRRSAPLYNGPPVPAPPFQPRFPNDGKPEHL